GERAASVSQRDPLAAWISPAFEAIGAHDDNMQAGGQQVRRDFMTEWLHAHGLPERWRRQPGSNERAPVGCRIILDFKRSPATAEVDERRSGLRIELPINEGNERLYDIEDDAAATGRSQNCFHPARFVKDNCWGHGAAGALSRRDGVGDGATLGI